MATRIGEWDPNPPTEGVTGYELSVDGAPVGTVPPTTTIFTFSVLPGTRTFGVVALNDTEPPPDNRSDMATVTQDVKGKPSKPVNFVIHV